jgi:hypothetical protein
MVKDEVWIEAGLKKDEIVCLTYLKIKLDRELKKVDFTNAPINFIFPNSPFYDPLAMEKFNELSTNRARKARNSSRRNAQ